MVGLTSARAESADRDAGAALARYVATGASQSREWATEAVNIEASIPRLAKQGSLRAIRRLLPFGKPEYQVLQINGDEMVRHQVIARYLSAEGGAEALPEQSVAITPANYRFRYRGRATEGGGADAYIFDITPHKKRAGLIRGQLWVDAASGMAVRLTGYLVKRPSIFVRRINITRDTYLQSGTAYARITQVAIDTRLVGRADLTVTEWPYSGPSLGTSAAEGAAEGPAIH